MEDTINLNKTTLRIFKYYTVCSCGCLISKYNNVQHQKTKKHKNNLKKLKQDKTKSNFKLQIEI
jgi:hypothetical protein